LAEYRRYDRKKIRLWVAGYERFCWRMITVLYTHSGKAGSPMNPGSPGSFLDPICLTHGKSEASQHTCPCATQLLPISPHTAKLATGG